MEEKVKKTIDESNEKTKKGNESIYTYIGIIMYVAVTVIDRFAFKVTDNIYFPIAILGILLILLGFIKNNTKE